MKRNNRPSASLERELSQALRAGDTWLVLRAFQDEFTREYDWKLSDLFSHAIGHLEESGSR